METIENFYSGFFKIGFNFFSFPRFARLVKVMKNLLTNFIHLPHRELNSIIFLKLSVKLWIYLTIYLSIDKNKAEKKTEG